MNRSRFGNLFHFLIFFLRQTKTDWAVKANATERYNAVRRSRVETSARNIAQHWNVSAADKFAQVFDWQNFFALLSTSLHLIRFFHITIRDGGSRKSSRKSVYLVRKAWRFPRNKSARLEISDCARWRSSQHAKTKCLFLVSPVAKCRIALMDWFPRAICVPISSFSLVYIFLLLRCLCCHW